MTWIEEPYIWDHEATGVCSDLAPTRRWTVALPPPRDCEGRDGKDSDEAEAPNDMAETTFVHYLRNIFETLDEWNDEHDADHMNAEASMMSTMTGVTVEGMDLTCITIIQGNKPT
jgi:hypothetical protein